MPYVTSFERFAKEEGREEGREEGLKEGIRTVLALRFGAEGLQLMPQIDGLTDVRLLQSILERAGHVAAAEQLLES